MASLKGVKLVIWDLDDTFWTGTLTEGGIQPRPELQQVVAKLARCGIVSSICSNNDLAPAREALEAQGMWESFVFPAISWESKPAMISALITAMQLRPQNVLFVDDKPRIREQVHAALPDLLPPCDDRELLEAFRSELASAPDTDSELQRLDQYKLLERKATARTVESQASPDAFLASCDIRCYLISDLAGLESRLVDLISRANQLNFTKRRRTAEELRALHADPEYDCRAIRVTDRFGDYGICGFMALRRADRTLTDFLFSCRVLEMGVEDAVHAWLGAPTLAAGDASGADEAAERFTRGAKAAFWVRILEGVPEPVVPVEVSPSSADPLRVVLAGGCDLVPIHAYLGMRSPVPLELTTQFTFTNTDSVRTTSFAAASLLRLASRPDLVAKYSSLLARLPWFDRSAFTSPLLSTPFDAFVGSAARDYFLAIYRHRHGELTIPFEYYRAKLTDFTRPEHADYFKEASKRNAPSVSDEFVRWFASEFRFEGPMSPQAYVEHLTWLCTELCRGRLVVMLNCTDGELQWSSVPRDWGSAQDMVVHLERNREMNRALRQAAEQLDNLRIVDVNRYIAGPQDAPDPLHFSRRVMFQITMEVSRILAEHAAARTGQRSGSAIAG